MWLSNLRPSRTTATFTVDAQADAAATEPANRLAILSRCPSNARLSFRHFSMRIALPCCQLADARRSQRWLVTHCCDAEEPRSV